jgi:hypothetical protein
MTDAVGSLIAILIIISGVGISLIWFRWFPKRLSSDFRIKEKKVGKYLYYKAQVRRPIIGWSSFYASIHEGSITSFGGWDRDKGNAVEQIKNYQDLRP